MHYETVQHIVKNVLIIWTICILWHYYNANVDAVQLKLFVFVCKLTRDANL